MASAIYAVPPSISSEDGATCSVCFDLFTSPRRMPSCGHTFCLDCLEQFDREAVSSADDNDPATHTEVCVRCPICRSANPIGPGGVSAFPPNKQAEEAAAKERRERGLVNHPKPPNQRRKPNIILPIRRIQPSDGSFSNDIAFPCGRCTFHWPHWLLLLITCVIISAICIVVPLVVFLPGAEIDEVTTPLPQVPRIEVASRTNSPDSERFSTKCDDRFFIPPSNDSLNWFLAQVSCNKNGGHLAFIKTNDDKLAVSKFIESHSAASSEVVPTHYWIGLAWTRGKTGKKAWQWLDESGMLPSLFDYRINSVSFKKSWPEDDSGQMQHPCIIINGISLRLTVVPCVEYSLTEGHKTVPLCQRICE